MTKNSFFAYSCLVQVICFIVLAITSSAISKQMGFVGGVLSFVSFLQFVGGILTAIGWAKENFEF